MRTTFLKITLLTAFMINFLQSQENELTKHLKMGEELKDKEDHNHKQDAYPQHLKKRQNFLFKKGTNLNSNFLSVKNRANFKKRGR